MEAITYLKVETIHSSDILLPFMVLVEVSSNDPSHQWTVPQETYEKG